MFETTLVREWMTPKVFTIEPTTPLSEAHQIMKDKKVRRLPVLKHGELVGIVTIGDIREASPSKATTLSIWELNYLWAQLTVERIMSHHVLTVTPQTNMVEAAQMMLDHKVSGLPVVEGDNLVGMLTESDIFRMLVRSKIPTT